MKMKKKGFAAGGMKKKGFAAGGMKKKGFAEGGLKSSLRPKLRPNTSQGLADPMSTKGPSPVLTPAMKRKQLEEKRKKVSKSPGMSKRLNVSGATGAKGSEMGSQVSSAMMAKDPARGGVDPANERAKSMLSGMADMKKGGGVKKMKGGGMAKKGYAMGGLYGKGAMEKELEAKKMTGGGMKKGGMAKKGFKAGGITKKGKAKGGKSKVRGAGIAQRGVRATKMR